MRGLIVFLCLVMVVAIAPFATACDTFGLNSCGLAVQSYVAPLVQNYVIEEVVEAVPVYNAPLVQNVAYGGQRLVVQRQNFGHVRQVQRQKVFVQPQIQKQIIVEKQRVVRPLRSRQVIRQNVVQVY